MSGEFGRRPGSWRPEEGADLLVVELAALLHDIADWKFAGGDETAGPAAARAWLGRLRSRRADDRPRRADRSRFVVQRGRRRKRPCTRSRDSVVQDADRLDALGAIGIARAFAYGGHKGRALYDPAIRPERHDSFAAYKRNSGPTINHFYEKLLLLADRMQTAAGRKLAAERHAYMEGVPGASFIASGEGSRNRRHNLRLRRNAGRHDAGPLRGLARDRVARYGLELSEDRFYALGGWPTLARRRTAGARGRRVGRSGADRPREGSRLRTAAARSAADRAGRQRRARSIADGCRSPWPPARRGRFWTWCWGRSAWLAGSTPRFAPRRCRITSRPPTCFSKPPGGWGLIRARCLVYEDTDPGIEAARRAGMAYIDVRTLFTPRRVSA